MLGGSHVGFLWIAGIVVAVLIIVLLWVNVSMLNKLRVEERSASGQGGAVQQPSPAEAPSQGGSGKAAELRSEAAAASVATTTDASATVERKPSVTASMAVEVVHDAPGRKSVFARPEHPFCLNEVQVPEFTADVWRDCFYKLAKEPQILGWIAFSGEAVGASDREYEGSFLESLRAYRRMVVRVQKEIGLNEITETSIVGDEGKVWFLTVVDDAWLALFMERTANIDHLLSDVLPALQHGEQVKNP